LFFLLIFYFKGTAQVPATKETIQCFIDSIGKSNDRQVITSSIFPSFANGKNFKWRIKIWQNSKKELLWVETIIPDSISTAFFYYQDTLIFAGELTYTMDTISHRQTPLFRNIFFHQSRIIEDTAPERNSNKADHYITESRNYLELSKKESLNMGIIELLNRGVIPDSKSVTRPNQ
jgi:sensor histidine kinase YesM